MKTIFCLSEAFREGSDGYFQRISACIVFFVVVHVGAKVASNWSPLLASRPTVVGATIHGVLTSWLALAVTIGAIDLSWWPYAGLPLSLGYLATDIVFYCIPKRDVTITCHHLVMAICHFTSGTTAGAAASGVGDSAWAQWTSVLGYLSELPNPLLNTRWFMLKTLKEHSFIYSLNNFLLLVTWVGSRLVVLPCNIIFRILPRLSEFAADGAYDLLGWLLAGHVIIILLSLDWLSKLLRGGLRSYFVFDPKAGPGFNPNVVQTKKVN